MSLCLCTVITEVCTVQRYVLYKALTDWTRCSGCWEYEVLWSGEGVPVHLVNGSWVLLGEKTVHRVKIVQDISYYDRVTHLVLSDGVPDYVLLDK